VSIEFIEADQCAVSVMSAGSVNPELFALGIGYGTSTTIEVEGTLDELELLVQDMSARIEKMRGA
jgi:hypothetical protein